MISTQLQKELNKTISGVHQIREPVDRARAAVELITHLQQVIRDLSQGRGSAVARRIYEHRCSKIGNIKIGSCQTRTSGG
jgi:hypothetical protein